MKQLSLFQGSPEDFQKPIIKTIQKEFETLKTNFQPKEPEEFLTRHQLAKMLHVDLSTIHNMRKRGQIIAFQISGRILFKRSLILKDIVELKILKK